MTASELPEPSEPLEMSGLQPPEVAGGCPATASCHSGAAGSDSTDRGGGGAVRVVTVAYNPGEELGRFLASVRTATRRPVTVVIADNGSDHGVVESCAQAYGARVVGDGTNRGYGGGANLAAADLAEGEDWVVVANPDLVWRPGSLDVLVDAAVANPHAGCLGPRLLNPDGTVYPSGRALPSLVRGAGHALLGRVWPSNPFSAAYYGRYEGGREGSGGEGASRDGGSGGGEGAGPGGQVARQDGSPLRRVGWLSGACLLLPAEAWRRLGGFDEGYFMFFEDVDLGQRVGAAGWANLQVLDAEVVHEQGASWKARPERMIRAHHASARRYLGRRYVSTWQAPLRWCLAAGLRLREEAAVWWAHRHQDGGHQDGGHQDGGQGGA